MDDQYNSVKVGMKDIEILSFIRKNKDANGNEHTQINRVIFVSTGEIKEGKKVYIPLITEDQCCDLAKVCESWDGSIKSIDLAKVCEGLDDSKKNSQDLIVQSAWEKFRENGNQVIEKNVANIKNHFKTKEKNGVSEFTIAVDKNGNAKIENLEAQNKILQVFNKRGDGKGDADVEIKRCTDITIFPKNQFNEKECFYSPGITNIVQGLGNKQLLNAFQGLKTSTSISVDDLGALQLMFTTYDNASAMYLKDFFAEMSPEF